MYLVYKNNSVINNIIHRRVYSYPLTNVIKMRMNSKRAYKVKQTNLTCKETIMILFPNSFTGR